MQICGHWLQTIIYYICSYDIFKSAPINAGLENKSQTKRDKNLFGFQILIYDKINSYSYYKNSSSNL